MARSAKMSPAEAEMHRIVTPGLTHYQVLALPPLNATSDHVTPQRNYLARLTHPDKWANGTETQKRLAHDATSRLNAAAAVLADPKARKRYDAELRRSHRPCAAGQGEGARKRQKGFAALHITECEACGGAGWLPKEAK